MERWWVSRIAALGMLSSYRSLSLKLTSFLLAKFLLRSPVPMCFRNTGPWPAVCLLCSMPGFSLTYFLIFRVPVGLASFHVLSRAGAALTPATEDCF